MAVGRDHQVIGRIAPSPSGEMHLGNAFSALLAWGSARSEQGSFILRLEDLDERCKNPAHTSGLLDDLAWLGIDWDEEPTVQSCRLDAYADALEYISQRAEIYPCFCSRADLHAASAPHASDGTPLYARTCYGLSDGRLEKRMRERDGRYALRIHVPDRTISFDDVVQGYISQDLARECGDFVLRRSDGVFAYQLVCVVDDIASKITQVVRGSDLLASTPRQIFLYELLGAPVPRYFHHPLLLARDGRRLSKRDADLSIQAMRAQGTRAEEIIGRIASYANLIDEPAPLTAAEFASIFKWSNVGSDDIVVA